MRSLNDLDNERGQTDVILGLTRAFEGIASMRIAQVKDRTLRSSKFFAELWQIYSQIRVDEYFHFGRDAEQKDVIQKELIILITSEGSLSGDIDDHLIRKFMRYYKPEKNDVITVGYHGSQLLAQHDVAMIRSFRLPGNDDKINVAPLQEVIQKYSSTTVFYASYVSIMTQDIKTIQMENAVAAKGQNVDKGQDIISEDTYIFEPSTFEVVSYLERTMVKTMLGDLILESKLAQYASRFKAMSLARQKAQDTLSDLTWLYNRSKRHIRDERLKNITNSVRSVDKQSL